MNYANIRRATFINRPNRFIANILVGGKPEVCHVKNTGRCKELLVENADIYVQESDNQNRKTRYDLISVVKGHRLINIDSQAPNKVFYEWLLKNDTNKLVRKIKTEYTYRSSRFDFYIETEQQKILVEVKGVTLEESGVVLFPDAPTERGLKHVKELTESIEDGFSPYVVFIVQMKDVLYFTPNNKTHRDFAEALSVAYGKGVKIQAIDCEVTSDSITAKDFVKVVL